MASSKDEQRDTRRPAASKDEQRDGTPREGAAAPRHAADDAAAKAGDGVPLGSAKRRGGSSKLDASTGSDGSSGVCAAIPPAAALQRVRTVLTGAVPPSDAPADPQRVVKDIASDFCDGAADGSFYSTGDFTVVRDVCVCADGDEWEERISVANRCKFYVNRRRGVKQWACPEGFGLARLAEERAEYEGVMRVETLKVLMRDSKQAVADRAAEIRARNMAWSKPKPVGPWQRSLTRQYTRVDPMTVVKTLTDSGRMPCLATAKMGRGTGAWYWEVELLAFCVERARGIVVGICRSTVAQWDANVARGADGRGYKISNGHVIFGEDERSAVVEGYDAAAPIKLQDRFGLEYNSTTGALSVYKNDVCMGEVASGLVGSDWRPFVELVYAGDSVRLRDGMRAPDFDENAEGAFSEKGKVSADPSATGPPLLLRGADGWAGEGAPMQARFRKEMKCDY